MLRIVSRRLFSTANLKTLREVTGAPLMDCKNALAASDGDLEKAKQWIAERNKAVAAKISGRTAKQGLIGVALSESAGALVEVNCETDFVARGEDFQGLVRQQAEAVMKATPLGEDVVTKVAGKVRENIVLGGTMRLAAAGNGGVLGSYLHNKLGDNVGTSAAIVALSNVQKGDLSKVQELARAIAVQVVAAKPAHIAREQVPADVRKTEEDRILSEAGQAFAGKSEKAKESMLKGRMQKFYSDMCLMDQVFILGELEGKMVKEVLPKGVRIDGFIRMSVGGDQTKASQ